MFGDKALNGAQINYSATRRELLGIVVALNACSDYLRGRHFRLYTDHRSLAYFHSQKKLNFMHMNHLDTLLDFDFTVIHRPGIEMILPDALSRMFDSFRRRERQLHGNNPAVLALANAEVANHPDQELRQFIAERFNKTFVTKEERESKLQAAHANGHFGAETLFKSLWRSGYYWPNMRADCAQLVDSCLQCLRFNVGKAGYHPRTFIDATLPFDISPSTPSRGSRRRPEGITLFC